MNENKQVRYYDDDEIEIDLVELFYELKANLAMIAGVTAAFVAAAAVYSFMILKPVYGFTALLRVPNYNVYLHNTCVEVLKQDMGQGGLSGVALGKTAAAITLSFSGDNPEQVTKDAKAYLPKAVEKVQRIVNEYDDVRFVNDRVGIAQLDLLDIKSRVAAGGDNAEVVGRLDALLKRLEEKHISLKVELSAPDKASNVPIAPNKPKNMGIAFAAGLFLSCGWVVAKYIFLKSREGK